MIGFACWAIDRVACEILEDGPLPFNPQLHAYWHIFTALALHNAGLLAAWWEKEGQKGSPKLCMLGGGLVGYLEGRGEEVHRGVKSQ